jgi:hypothetical protein
MVVNTHAFELQVVPAGFPPAARQQLPWIAGGLLGGFLIPFVLADQLSLQKDLYSGLYGAFVFAFFAAWTRATAEPLTEMLRRRWLRAVALGLLCGAVLVIVVFGQDATSRPSGIDLAGAVLWRGVFYGAVDGLMLSSFPILAVFAAFKETRLNERRRGKIVIGALALVASLLMTATYHVGYSDFRSAKLRSPVAGDVVWSAPTLLTLNPVGAPIAHAALHTSAVTHSYNTDLFLPPHR